MAKLTSTQTIFDQNKLQRNTKSTSVIRIKRLFSETSAEPDPNTNVRLSIVMSFTVNVCIKVSFWWVWGEPGLEWVKQASQRSLADLELTKNLPLYNLCVWYSSRIVFYECNFQPQPSINIFRKQCSATKVRVGRNCSWALAVITILMCACFLTCFVHIGNSALIVCMLIEVR